MVASHDESPPPSLESIAELARLAMEPPASVRVEHVVRACAIVRDALGAAEAYVVRSGDPHFVRVDADADPTAYEIKQRGYYLIWRELSSNLRLPAGGVRVADRLVVEAVPVQAGSRTTHLASLLPGFESSSEMLIVRGPWPEGLCESQVEFVTIARPLLSSLVNNLLDAERQARQRRQLGLLADIAGAFSQAEQTEGVLTGIATALAKASGFDWVSLVVSDPRDPNTTERAQNISRHSGTATAEQFWTLEGQDAVWAAQAGDLERSGKPILVPDVFSPPWPETDNEEFRRYYATLKRHYERSHIRSTAVFPIFFQEQFIGVAMMSSSTPRSFPPEEVEFLTALVTQAAASIGGLRLHRELRHANETLAHLASHDPLTGLANRSLFLDRLRAALAPAAPTTRAGDRALLFVDLDDFKAINDTLGHQAGDDFLVEVARRLTASVRPVDTVARFGGDEFAVLLGDVTTATAARRVAARLLDALRAPIRASGRESFVAASIGIALGVPGRTTADELIRAADSALYQAKGEGKERAAVFDPARHSPRAAAEAVHAGLRRPSAAAPSGGPANR